MVMQVYGDQIIKGETQFYKGASIMTLGHHIASRAPEGDGHWHFHVHSEYDDITGLSTADSKVVCAYGYVPREELQPDYSGEITGTDFGFTMTSPGHLLVDNIYYKTGNTAATEPVRICIYQGNDETGILVFDQEYPASQFPANSDVTAEYAGHVEFDPYIDYFVKYESAAPFSLKANSIETIPYFAADTSYLREDNLLQTKPWAIGESWGVGDYLIKNRKIYTSNTAGSQTGTFEANSDKWDILPTKTYVDDAIAAAVIVEDIWDRVGTTIQPKNSGDNLAIGINSLYVDYDLDRVGINTNTPGAALEVVGNVLVTGQSVSVSNGNILAYGLGGITDNFVGGLGAGAALTTGLGNILIGYNAANLVATEAENVIIGFKAGEFASLLDFSIGIGPYALINADAADYTVAIGRYSGENSNGTNCLYLGNKSGRENDTDDKLFIANDLGTLIEGDFANKWVTIRGNLAVDSTGISNNAIHVENSLGNTLFYVREDANSDGQVDIHDSSGAIKVQICANADSYINGGGNFGIGTDIPQVKLDLSGDMRAIGAVNIFGDLTVTNDDLISDLVVFRSNSADISTRDLVHIHNDNPLAVNTVALQVTQDANDSALSIDANGVVTETACRIMGDALSTGSLASFISNSPDLNARTLVFIHNDNVAAAGATPLLIKQDVGGAMALEMDGGILKHRNTATTGIGWELDADYITTGKALYVQCNALQSGNIAHFYSNSSNVTSRNLVEIHNDHASAIGTACLRIENDSSGLAISTDGSIKLDNGSVMLDTGSLEVSLGSINMPAGNLIMTGDIRITGTIDVTTENINMQGGDILVNGGKLSFSGSQPSFMPPELPQTGIDVLINKSSNIVFNTTFNVHQGWDGTSWRNFY